MKLYLILLLILTTIVSCKNNSSFAPNAKLLVVEEAYVCEHCETVVPNDTLKTIRYQYDNRNRLIFRLVKDISSKRTDSSKYYYNRNDELIRSEDFFDGFDKPEITEYHYDKGIPIYFAMHDTSVKNRNYYTVVNHKIIKISTAGGRWCYNINYIENKAVVYSITDTVLQSADTDKFSDKHSPYYGNNTKWKNLLWNIHYPENAVIEHSQFFRSKRKIDGLSPYTHEKYTYDYNEQGYPIKRTGYTTFMSFPVTTIVLYKYTLAH